MKFLLAISQSPVAKKLATRLVYEKYTIDIVNDIGKMQEFLLTYKYDILLIESEVSNFNTVSVIDSIRKKRIPTPIILLNSKKDIGYGIASLNAGANDYIMYPYDLDDLLARLRVLLRVKIDSLSNVIYYNNLSADRQTLKVFREHVDVGLTAREFYIVEYMIRNKEIVLTREMIINNIWGIDYVGNSNIIDVHIHYIRKKIDDGFSPKLLHTVKNAGYVLRE